MSRTSRRKAISAALLLSLPQLLLADDKQGIRNSIRQITRTDGAGFLWIAEHLEGIARNLSGVITGVTAPNSNARKVFYLFMAVFAVANTLLFCYQQNVMKDKRQWTDLLQTGFKAMQCCALMALIPLVPEFLIRLMWRLAEFILSQRAGTMSYTLPIHSFNGWFQTFGLTTGTGLSVASILHPGVHGYTIVSGIALGNYASLVYALTFAGWIATIVACLTYMMGCLSLHFAVFVLVLHLPSIVFDGFGQKAMNVIKYFWTSAIKAFLGAIMIMLVCSSAMEKTGKDILGILATMFIKPLVLSVMLPLSSSIINGISQGMASGDDAQSARGAVGQATGSIMAARSASAKAGGEMARNRQRNAEGAKARSALASMWSDKQGGKALTAEESKYFSGLDNDQATAMLGEMSREARAEQLRKFMDGRKKEAEAESAKTPPDAGQAAAVAAAGAAEQPASEGGKASS